MQTLLRLSYFFRAKFGFEGFAQCKRLNMLQLCSDGWSGEACSHNLVAKRRQVISWLFIFCDYKCCNDGGQDCQFLSSYVFKGKFYWPICCPNPFSALLMTRYHQEGTSQLNTKHNTLQSPRYYSAVTGFRLYSAIQNSVRGFAKKLKEDPCRRIVVCLA